jgi:hypothetical protein
MALCRLGLRARDGSGQSFEQLAAVGQAGERIVPRLVGELLLGAQALADLSSSWSRLVKLIAGE